ncbi:FG-GAP-like repeat-containing protein [Ulvibacterium sp.]|uniref:FG-GAP-like repeat-containing protein n=1 Tax=Ulvibacterium sp. TaxID=2665914 RepID=UPI003CC58DC0
MKAKNLRTKDRVFTIFLLLGISFTAISQTDPTVEATAPSANALGVDNAATLSLTFSETIDTGTLTADNVKISGSYGKPFGFPALRSNTNTAVFDPDRDFFPGEMITATLTVGVASNMGAPLESPFTYSFTAGVSPDSPGEFPKGQNIIFEGTQESPRNDVTVADLDGDGDLDVLAAHEQSIGGAWYENDGNGNFGALQSIDFGNGSLRDIITADLDGDGNLDVLALANSDTRISLYLNDGSGTFTKGIGLRANPLFEDFTVGDLDGDGDPDILAASPGKLTWHSNEGLTFSGTQRVPTIFGTERIIDGLLTETGAVAIADLDGDGDLDALVTTFDKIAWYENDGHGNFGTSQTITLSADGAEDMIVADMDGNGHLDVISTYSNDNQIAWYPNYGNANFSGHGNLITADAEGGASIVTIADLDGDGDLDVLSTSISNNSSIFWYENDGRGNFDGQQTITTEALGTLSVSTGDLDGDGDLDVLSAHSDNGTIAWYENAASSLTVIATGPAANAISVDNAATLSLTFSETVDGATLSADNIKISGNYGRPMGFGTPSVNANTTVFDPDRDFLPGEVITATLTTDVASSTGNLLASPFTYQFIAGVNPDSPGEFPNGQNTIFEGGRSLPRNDVTVADLDGDGDLDVIANHAPRGSIGSAWYENDGSGNLGDPQSIDLGIQSFTGITTADLDGDGNLEVLAATTFDAQIAWYLNDGSKNFTEGKPITFSLERLDDRVKDFTIGDLDGDGDLDILSASSNKIAWHPNDGLTFGVARNPLIFGAERIISTAAVGVSGVAVADLDGDGDLDALAASANDNRIAWYPNDGSGNFGTQRTITTAAAGALDVIVADLDSDGDLDVISASANDNRIAWHPNDGSGNFGGQRTITTAVDGIRDVTVADLDGDGDLDVLSASFDDNQVAWYPNDGNGNFGDQQTIITAGSGDGYTAVATGDLDGDGDLDVLSARSNQGRIAWYENAGATTLTANCTDPFTLQLDASGTASITAEDIDNGSMGATGMDIDITDFDCSHLGENTVTLTVTDASGATETCTTIITVEDAMAPIADRAVLPDVRDGCGATITSMPTATDNCAGTITATTDDPLAYPDQGTYTITWTYDDGNGNTSTQEQTVIVESSITSATPDMDVLPDVTGECSATVTAVPTATADCGGTVNATTDDPLEYDRPGTFTVTWTYDTGDGNTSTQTQTVIVEDSVAPVPDMAALPDVTGGCGATVTILPTATDNCVGTVTATTDDPLTYPEQGTYTVTWTYDDGNGNTSTQVQTVIAESSIAPPIPDMASLPEVRGECSATVTAVPTATDNCAGTVIGTTDDPLEYDRPGTFTVTWTYDTGNGNTSTQMQNVIVEDVVPPMAIAQDITVELDENGQATITAEDIDNGSADNCGIADLSLDTAIFDCPELGGTDVELTVTDVSGNSSSATATVTFTAPDSDSDGLADVCGTEISIVPGQGVSPNADGIHDTWVIENIADHPDALVKVFDRNGREVFSTIGYRNDWGGTEGTGSGLLPVGSYYYVVHLRQPIARNITGWLYLNY